LAVLALEEAYQSCFVGVQISEQQPDIVGVQEIRYKYSGGPDQLTELANELQLLNQTYNHVYQPAMYYDNEARFLLSPSLPLSRSR
jgi:endonuclease/exonuclease/phosphatase family metal-dependent hydrolase